MVNQLVAMRVFVAVIETGSFVRAAEQLRMSRTAVSRFVAELERHLGARLLQRSTRRLSLTETGAAYYDRCRQILADVEEADAVAGAAEAQPRGVLRVSLPYSFGLRFVAPLLPDFCIRHPALTLEVSFSDRLVDLVEEGIDVALRISRNLRTTLVARRLVPIRFATCAAPGYLAERGTPRTPDELRDHNCLLYAYSASGDSWRFLRDGVESAVPVDGPFRTNNGDMLRIAALAGRGIVHEPTFLVGDDLRAGALVRVLADYPAPEAAAYAVYLGGARRSARVRAFVEYLMNAFGGEHPVWDEGLI